MRNLFLITRKSISHNKSILSLISLKIQDVFAVLPYWHDANLGKLVFDQFDPKTLIRLACNPDFIIADDMQGGTISISGKITNKTKASILGIDINP